MYIAHLHLFAQRMVPLQHISPHVDNTTSDIWKNQSSIIFYTAVGLILCEENWILWYAHIHVSIFHISGAKNTNYDAASQLTQILVPNTIRNFCDHFQHPSPLDSVFTYIFNKASDAYHDTLKTTTKRLYSYKIHKYTTSWSQWYRYKFGL